MTKLTLDISMSLDGFIAGPDATLDAPLGRGGEQLHEWIFPLAAWREPHGLPGGTDGADSDLLREAVARNGATILGRRMFSGGAGPWADDPKRDSWWGADPPFHHPVFVLTHHAREPLVRDGGTTFTFVTAGIEAALELAREAAGPQDVGLAGGADVAQQYLAAGLLDELQVHVVPVLLGGGVRLFDGTTATLERTRLVDSPTGVVHARYRAVR